MTALVYWRENKKRCVGWTWECQLLLQGWIAHCNCAGPLERLSVCWFSLVSFKASTRKWHKKVEKFLWVLKLLQPGRLRSLECWCWGLLWLGPSVLFYKEVKENVTKPFETCFSSFDSVSKDCPFGVLQAETITVNDKPLNEKKHFLTW